MEYRTEDGVQVKTGDRVYNYYDMEPGTIGDPASGFGDWFDFHADSGKRTLLNGQRICTIAFAARRGFKNAA